MPPPDDPEYAGHSKAPSRARPWFPSQQSSSQAAATSYQSGGIPTFNHSQAGGFGNTATEEVESQNQWETRYGMRVDVLSAFAYILGPISGTLQLHDLISDRNSILLALLVLIVETQNDYVRFHGTLLLRVNTASNTQYLQHTNLRC